MCTQRPSRICFGVNVDVLELAQRTADLFFFKTKSRYPFFLEVCCVLWDSRFILVTCHQ
jgi:hypothetical protein